MHGTYDETTSMLDNTVPLGEFLDEQLARVRENEITETNDINESDNEDSSCRCQNRRISGRGSRTVCLGSMVTRGRGHDVYPGSGPLDGGNTLRPA